MSTVAVALLCFFCLVGGAFLGIMMIALCIANGGSDDECTGCSSPESKSENTCEGT